MSLLKPTKITWITFGILLGANVLSALFGLLLMGLLDAPILATISFIPAFWLSDVFGLMGFELLSPHGNEFGRAPNSLGVSLLVVGSFISLLVYYIMSSLVSKHYNGLGNLDRYI